MITCYFTHNRCEKSRSQFSVPNFAKFLENFILTLILVPLCKGLHEIYGNLEYQAIMVAGTTRKHELILTNNLVSQNCAERLTREELL